MTIIAIDSSGPVAGIAIVKDGALLAEYNINYKKKHSQTLLPMLEQAASMVDISMTEVDAIAVTEGPGSFTGLRIGSAMAKGLACALKKPLIAVPTLEAIAANMFGVSGIICPIMDARRGQVYNGLYRYEGDELVTIENQRAIALSEVIDELNAMNEPVIFTGDGVPVYAELIKETAKVPFRSAPMGHDRQRASSVACVAMKYLENDKTVSADEFKPVYLRASQPEQAKAKA